MRRKISILLIFVLMMTLLGACDGGDDKPEAGKPRNGGTPTQEAPTGEPTGDPTGSPTGEPTVEPVATPTPTPSPTPTVKILPEDPSLTPFPLPSQLPTPMDVFFDENYPENKALLAFADYLQNLYDNYKGDKSGLRYGLFFLNQDEVPELWWVEGGSRVDTVNMVMLTKDMKAQQIGSFGEFATCHYMLHRGNVYSFYEAMGTEILSVDYINFTSFEHAITLTKQEIETPDGIMQKFFIDELPCLKADYETRFGLWNVVGSEFDRVIRYEDGKPMQEEDGYPPRTFYTPLFQMYLDCCEEDPEFGKEPFMYGIPADILDALSGEWICDSGEVEGWEWKASEEGIKKYWTIEPNGEAEYKSVAPNQELHMYGLNYMANYPIIDTDYPWAVFCKDAEVTDGNATYYLTLTKEGKLLQYYYYPSKYVASVTYYVKKK